MTEKKLTQAQILSGAAGAISGTGAFTARNQVQMISRDQVFTFGQALKRLYPELVDATPGANQVFLLKSPTSGKNIQGYSSGKIVFSKYPKADESIITPADVKVAEALLKTAILEASKLTDQQLAEHNMSREQVELAAAQLGIELPTAS